MARSTTMMPFEPPESVMNAMPSAPRRRSKRKSLTRQGKRKAAPDLVRRRFDAVAPDLLWYGDMTEIETGEGKIYLATVIDAFSRRCLGYAMGEHHDAALVGASLKMAAVTRGGSLDGTIFHSDRGAEYTSEAYNKLCDRLGVVQSMGRVGSALDNAAAESFNSLVKVEYIHRRPFAPPDRGPPEDRHMDHWVLQPATKAQRGRRPTARGVRKNHRRSARATRPERSDRITKVSTEPGG
ncbi:IS3 family transposase [Streptomyces sp. 1222.2]|uniref:IS3 family transposase n=1 Tax=Streptomyces sp. 1222.2 TaxID=1938833 RepID=UPI0015CF612F|nr:IS3 family transposase [Streptomyces sp. 1222.2]